MKRWMPEGLIVIGCVLAGVFLIFQSKREQETPLVEEMPAESATKSDCGAQSLYLICRINGVSGNMEEIRKRTKTSVTGTSMFDLKEAAEQQGFKVRGDRCTFERLRNYVSKEGCSAILYFKNGHFAPVVRVTEEKVKIIDTRRLEIRDCSADDLNNMGWDKTALLLQKQ